MSQIVTRPGAGSESRIEAPDVLPFEAFWEGRDLPEDVPLGVLLEVDADPEDLAPWFGRLCLVVIPFAAHSDGRGFSLAQKLRDAGYKGRIRARGHLLADQFRAALRVGIDEIEIDDANASRMPAALWRALSEGGDYRSRVFAAG
ncbi:MAG: DUF934 domain-containing protein [Pseudomonadota bacterium]